MKQGQRSMPILPATDVSVSVQFYVERLGFELVGSWLDDKGNESFAIVRLDTITIGLRKGKAADETPDWAAYLYVLDISAYVDQVLSKGTKLSSGPKDSFYHCREVEIVDPSLNRLCFSQDLEPSSDGPGL